jgi:hypothetical protein
VKLEDHPTVRRLAQEVQGVENRQLAETMLGQSAENVLHICVLDMSDHLGDPVKMNHVVARGADA